MALTVPHARDYELLPRWVRAACAVRSGERAFELAVLTSSALSDAERHVVRKALKDAHRAAADGRPLPYAIDDVVANVAHSRQRVDRRLSHAVYSVAYAVHACYTDPVNAALDTARGAAHACFSAKDDEEAELVLRSCVSDYRLGISLAAASGWGDTTPADPAVLGRLWPKPDPATAHLPIALPLNPLFPNEDQPSDKVLSIYVEAEPGDEEDVAELLIALSDMHRAAGGLGLTFRGTETRSLIAAEVPA